MLPSANQDNGLGSTITGSSSDVAGRQRGRPLGSKNKPKPTVFITREVPSTLLAHILKVASGCNIVNSIASYARCRQGGVSIISGSGNITNVCLSQPSGEIVNLQGRYQILSLSGSFVLPPAPAEANSLNVFLLGEQGQVVAGSVVGMMIADGPVTIMTALFTDFVYAELPLEEEPVLPQHTANQEYVGGSGGNHLTDPSSRLLFPLNFEQLPLD